MPSLYISASVAGSMHIFICCGGICPPGMAISICHSPALRGGKSSARAAPHDAAPTSSSAPSPMTVAARSMSGSSSDTAATLGQDGAVKQLRCTIGHVERRLTTKTARPSPRWPGAVCPAATRLPQRHRAGAAGGRHPGAAGFARPGGRQRRGRGTALPGCPRVRRAGARHRTGSGAGGARPSRMPPPTAGPTSASSPPTSRRCRHSSAFDHACANPPYHSAAGTAIAGRFAPRRQACGRRAC